MNNVRRQEQLSKNSVSPEPLTCEEAFRIAESLVQLFGDKRSKWTMKEMISYTNAKNRSHVLCAINLVREHSVTGVIIRKQPNGKYRCFVPPTFTAHLVQSKQKPTDGDWIKAKLVADFVGNCMGYVMFGVFLLWCLLHV